MVQTRSLNTAGTEEHSQGLVDLADDMALGWREVERGAEYVVVFANIDAEESGELSSEDGPEGS